MIFDSNILIYAARDEYQGLLDLIQSDYAAVSAISRIEVYGYPGLKDADRASFDLMFRYLITFPVDEAIIEMAVQLRQTRRMSLGDSIIAATALYHGMTLVTRNTGDFDWIDDLVLLNPVDHP